MKVYVKPPQHSLGLQRIETALTRYAPPHVEIVPFQIQADLIVLYAIGRCEQLTAQAQHILSTGRKYAVIQVCLRSTQKPSTNDWWVLWEQATAVWSYYDLDKAIADDNGGNQVVYVPNFYHAPLGADAEVFRDPFVSPRWKDMPHEGRNFTIATSGLSYLSESVRECWEAARIVGGQVYHVGPAFRYKQGRKVTFSNDCSDKELALHYAASRFVSGLRRKEGFELPAVEGLLCGARPIVFDTPDYRWNYQDFAEYLHEGTRQEVVDQLVELFKQPVRQVTTSERERAVARFNWATIIKGFYERIR